MKQSPESPTTSRMRRSSRAPGGRVLSAGLLGISIVGACPTWGAAPSTVPSTMPSTLPLTAAPDWDQRIDDALAATGSVESVAASLAAEADTPAVLRAKTRVAIERGDLSAALAVLQKSARDPAALQSLAYLQELVGSTAAARQTLQAAAAEADPAVAADLTLRLAAIALDEGRAAEAAKLLDRVASAGPAAAGRAGVVAYLYGQYEAAARCLAGVTTPDVALRLLEGNAALKFGQTDAAAAAFGGAYEQARTAADRLYAQERLIAAARQAGTLGPLATQWLADPKLPVDRMLPLAIVLRELGRVPELLAWWRAASTGSADPARQRAVLDDRFVHEVLGAAQSAGRMDDAVAVCRELLARYPDDAQWLGATLQALLAAGRPEQADALLGERTAATEAPADLERLGRLARSLGRDAAAIAAAQKLAAFGSAAAITGDLLEASVYRRADDLPKTRELLKRAAAAALEHPAGVGAVVNAMETAGMDHEAVDLLQQSVARDPSEDALGRLASLLMKLDRQAEAIPVLERLTQTGSTAAVRTQAGNRLLEAADAAKTVPALIGRLEARLDGGRGDEEDLALLIDAYLRNRAFDDAVRALRTSPLLDERSRLGRLAVLFLRSHQPQLAKQTLAQLVNVDPDHATDTLERIAGLDLSLNQPDEAAQVIGRIEARIGGGPTSGELMAGVLDRLGRPADAAAQYRRALAVDPRNADDWLLFATAMAKAGRSETAWHRLQVLGGQADNDNLFAAAVDGLLNLQAPAAALRVARRDAILRAAQRPHEPILYDVIADLSDELQDQGAVVRATDASVSVSDEERPQRLRELMDIASRKNAIETAVDCGRSLLALGDDFPPELFLGLAERLLAFGRLPDAQRAIGRAAESADEEMVADRAADLYEKYGYPAAALDALRPLADRRRHDPDFRQTFGRLSEIVGDRDAAFENVFAAATTAVAAAAADRSPQHATPGQQTIVRGVLMHSVYVPPAPALENFGPVVGSLLGAARTPDQRTAVLDLLRGAVEAPLADPTLGDQPTQGLYALAMATRRASVSFARPEAADAVDAAVIRRWPNDSFKQDALAARVGEGLIHWAAAFAAANGLPLEGRLAAVLTPTTSPTSPTPTTSTTGPAATGPTTQRAGNAPVAPTLATANAGRVLNAAAERLPVMIARGNLEPAREMLKNVPIEVPQRPPGSATRPPQGLPPAQIMVIAASALGEQDLADRWALAWLDALATRRQRAQPPATGPASARPVRAAAQPVNDDEMGNEYGAGANQVVNGVWPLVDEGCRAVLAETLAARVAASPAGWQAALNALQLAASIGQTLPHGHDLAVRMFVAQPYEQTQAVCRMLALVPAAERPALLREALKQEKPTSQLALLTTFIGQAAEPLDDAMLAVVRDTAVQMPLGQSGVWGDWCSNAAQKPALAVLALAVLRTATPAGSPYTPAALTAAAMAYSVSGDAVAADDMAARAIAALRVPPLPEPPQPRAAPRLPGAPTSRPVALAVDQPPPERVGLLRTAVAALSPQARQTMLAETDTESKAAFVARADVVWRHLIRSLLLDAVGDRAAALTAARDAYAADTTDASAVQVITDRLRDDGCWAELVQVLSTRAGGNDPQAARVPPLIARALTNLYRWREARVNSDANAGGMPPTDLPRQAADGDEAGMAESLRAQIVQTAAGRPAQFPTIPPDGGLRGGQTPGSGNFDPPAALDQAARAPGAVDDLLQALRLPVPATDFDSRTWVATVLGRLVNEPAVYDRILAALQPAVDAHVFTHSERQVAYAMMRVPGRKLPAVWVDELRLAALADPAGDELRLLAGGLAAEGDPSSAAMSRWADTTAKALGSQRERPGGSSLPTPLDFVDDAHTAPAVAALCDRDPAAAEALLRNLRDTSRVPRRAVVLGTLWARCAAERGDMVAYRTRLDGVLTDWAWQRLAPQGPFAVVRSATVDLGMGLPRRCGEADRRAAVAVFGQSLDALAAKWPSDTEITCQLAVAGNWAERQGDPAAAEVLFRKAKALADRQGPGQHQVWVADLADQLGHADAAIAIERRLLEQRCLPAPRIVPLLHVLADRGEHDLAQRYATDAATYCNGINPADYVASPATQSSAPSP